MDNNEKDAYSENRPIPDYIRSEVRYWKNKLENIKKDEIWKPYMLIKNQETCELEITEKVGIGGGEVKRKVKIQNGRVVEKPKDVIILGTNTPDGFIIEGLKLKIKRTERADEM